MGREGDEVGEDGGMGVGCRDQADGEERSRKEDYTTSNHHWTQNQTAVTRKYIHTPYSSGAPLLREEESYSGQCSPQRKSSLLL